MIDTTTNKIVYNGDGSTREWNLTVPTTSGGTANLPAQNYTTDIELYLSNKTTEELTKITSNYEINATTHKIIYPTVESGLDVLTTNQQLIILRATPITQEKDHNARFFKSVDVEQIADKLTMVTQDLKEIADRAVCVPVNATETDKMDAKELIQEIKNLKETVSEISGDIPDITEELASKMPLEGGTFTGDVTLNSGVSLKTQNGRIHEVNNKIVIGDKSSDKGFYVSPNGETAALVGNTVKNILTNNDVTSTYSPSGVSPVNGQAVASAISDAGDGYLPKVFDGTQTITAKQNGNNITLNLNYKEDGGAESKTQIQEQYNRFLLTHSSKPEGGSFSQDGYFEIMPTRTAMIGKGGQYISLDNTGQIDINPTNSKKVRVNGYNVLTAAERGANNGVASLGSDGKVPSSQLPAMDVLPSQTGHSGQFLTTNGTDASWGDVDAALPAFPAPSETVSTVAYTAAGGTSGILGKEIQSITFDSNDTAIFNPAISSGPETMAFYIGRTSSYVPADDVLLTFNFTISDNVVSYAELVAQKYDPSSESMITLGSFAFVADFGNGPEWIPYDSNIRLDNGINIYWDSVNKKIWSDLNFIASSLFALADAVDNVFVFETITQNNALPAASGYANKLAYVYETGTYSDIKNLIYSDGTNWQFLPGAVLEIPDERMHDAAYKLTPAYCGIPLTTGQLAIPARNKSYAIYPNYSIGQMHEFHADSSDWLNRYWLPMNFGTIFNGDIQWLTQGDEYSLIPEVNPYIYSSCTFINNLQTTYTQTVKVNLLNYANFCQWVFAQGTNKIKLQFENATNAKVFLNGSAVNTSSDLLLDADSKTYIANFYNYSDSSGYLVMDIKELPYNPVNKVIALSSSTATLATNTNYTATVSGSASFILPTPAYNTSFENTINILLTVSSSTTVDWGVNANSVLTSFTAGKYEIRLRYNNATSNWIGEVLKQEATPSHTKCFVSFSNNYTDQTGNITLTPNFTPEYSDSEGFTAYAGTKSLALPRNDTGRGFTISDPNNALTFAGPFTVKFWVRLNGSVDLNIFKGFDGNSSNAFRIGQYSSVKIGTTTFSAQNSVDLRNALHYIEVTRDANNVVYVFVDGVLLPRFSGSPQGISGTIKLSDSTLCFENQYYGRIYVQDFVITDQVGHITNYDVPTAPYVISDNSLADLHDNTKQNALSQTQLNAVNSGIDSTKVAQIATNAYDIGLLQTALQNLSFVEFVVSLPTQDIKTGVIYCVPLNEADLSGKTIVEEFIYNNNQWYAVGAFSTNIDASTLVLKSMFEFDSGTGTLNINLGN